MGQISVKIGRKFKIVATILTRSAACGGTESRQTHRTEMPKSLYPGKSPISGDYPSLPKRGASHDRLLGTYTKGSTAKGDESSDNSKAVIDCYGTKVKSVFKGNGGQASAINSGFKVSRGDIILLLDADDYLFSDAVSAIVDAWESGVSQI